MCRFLGTLIIRKHGLDFHSFADDTQLYLTCGPVGPDRACNANIKIRALIL